MESRNSLLICVQAEALRQKLRNGFREIRSPASLQQRNPGEKEYMRWAQRWGRWRGVGISGQKFLFSPDGNRRPLEGHVYTFSKSN